MNEVTVFLLSYLGSLTGVLTALLPVIYLIKKKWENSAIGGMI